MASQGVQFRLLLWKNYILQKRKILVTFLEVGLPTLFALILIFIRQRVIATEITNATGWPAYSVDRLPASLHPTFETSKEWNLAYCPETTSINSIMENVKSKLEIKGKCLTLFTIYAFFCLVWNPLIFLGKLFVATPKQSLHKY